MFEEINEKINEAEEGIRKYAKIQSSIDEYQHMKEALLQKIEGLKLQLAKEDADVVKLEGMGLAHVFYTVTKHYENRMLKEQREALEAKLRYEQGLRELEDLEQIMEDLHQESLHYKNCENLYRELYTHKKDMLLKYHTTETQEILLLDEKISLYKNNIREIDEALTAAENALVFMDNLMDYISSCYSHGGRISIDEHNAEEEEDNDILIVAQRTLSRLKVELADVKLPQQMKSRIGNYEGFSDMIFNNMIMDSLGSTTSMTEKQVIDIIDDIDAVMKNLRDLRVIQLQEQLHLQEKQAALIAKI